MNLFLRFCRLLVPHWRKYALIICLSVFSGLVSLLNPYLMRWVVDEAIVRRDLGLFGLLGGVIIAVFFVEMAAGAWRQILDREVRLKLGLDLSRKVMNKVVSLSPLQLKRDSQADHLYKINYDCERVKGLLAGTVPEAAFIFPKLLMTVAILFSLDSKIACAALLIPVLYIPSFLLNRRVRILWQAVIESNQRLFRDVSEFFSNVQVVKAFGTEDATVRKYVRGYIRMIRLEIRKFRWEIAAGNAVQIAGKAALAVAAAWGGYEIIRGNLTPGALTSILVYLTHLAGLKGRIAVFFQNAALGLVSCRRVADVLDRKPRCVEKPGAQDFDLRDSGIIFEAVTFGYIPGVPVFKALTFEIPAASHVCLVGPSGCGKSTLAGLLLRMADPWEGRILMNGKDLSSLKRRCLRSQTAVALQEPFLWDDTVEANIRYGKNKATRDELLRAAHMAGVDIFAPDFLEACSSKLGERACRLSEGQKQKIAIARAVIRRPKVLILDEAMSSIDSDGEAKILERIRASDPGLLIVSISHRLSTVMKADRVYYLKKQDLVVSGPPGELILRDPDFSHLFRDQILAGNP